MSRRFTLSLAAFALATVAVASSASAQVIAYDHRSTVFGDHAAGYSELVRARGAFLKDHAIAAETWVRVAAARDQLHYNRVEHHYQVKQLELQYRRQKLDDKLARREIAQVADQQAALKLWQAAQHGVAQWPVALQRPEYASSMALVESVLRTWSPEDGASDMFRKALATETGVLQARIAANTTIAHASRVEAVRTLKQLQDLAVETTSDELATALAMK